MMSNDTERVAAEHLEFLVAVSAQHSTDRAQPAGIYRYRLDRVGGAVTERVLLAGGFEPSFFVQSPDGARLYAVGNATDLPGVSGQALLACTRSRDGARFNVVDAYPTGSESEPCHVSTDTAGRVVLIADYGAGKVASFRAAADGRLGVVVSSIEHRGSGPNAARQERAHPHAIYALPNDRDVLVPDLGTDRIVAYRLNAATGVLTERSDRDAVLRPGSGPRHLAVHPNGRYLYLANELDNTVTAFNYDDADATLHRLQTLSTLPDRFRDANTVADIHLHPDGRWVYLSNRGHDSIAIYRCDAASGSLEPAGHVSCGGAHPRNFAIDARGRVMVVANLHSDTLSLFNLDPQDGSATLFGVVEAVARPMCVQFARSC